jgi:hypothetical protein
VSNALSALLAGGTGLVGGHCLRALLDEPRYERILVLTRRDIGELAKDPRVTQLVTEFASLGGVRKRLRADHVFCAGHDAKAGSQRFVRSTSIPSGSHSFRGFGAAFLDRERARAALVRRSSTRASRVRLRTVCAGWVGRAW